MITEQGLLAAIAECQGERNPNANTAVKLAAFLTIKQAMYGDQQPPQAESKVQVPAYSYAPSAERETIGDYGKSDFLQAVNGKDPGDVWPIMDELMDTLKMINERVYNSIMRKIK